MPKKKWTKPILTILVRGRPEERILEYCKNDLVASGPTGQNNMCMVDGCSPCSLFPGS